MFAAWKEISSSHNVCLLAATIPFKLLVEKWLLMPAVEHISCFGRRFLSVGSFSQPSTNVHCPTRRLQLSVERHNATRDALVTEGFWLVIYRRQVELI
jgi:hypothetical protein